MNTKHTPGPWGFCDNIVTKDGYRLAECIGWEGNLEEDTANARLIAAAPELLDACRVAIEAIHAGRTVHNLPPISAQALRILRAAIAKAEGQL